MSVHIIYLSQSLIYLSAVYLSLFISIYLSIYLPIYLSIYELDFLGFPLPRDF